jgi:hypothetical protein
MTKTFPVATLAAVAVLHMAVAVSAASLVSAKKLEINVDEAKVEAERQALWAKIGGWCAIADWHPAVAKCEESKEGETEFRTLTLKDGGVVKEQLLERGNATYKYAIIDGPLPVKNYSAQFSVTPDDDDLDEINVLWSATYDANGKEDKDVRKIIDGIFKDGIESIKAKHGTVPGAKKDDD